MMSTLTWDTVTGDGLVTGGSGIWSTSLTYWTRTNGTSNTTFSNGDAVIFQGTGGAVLLSGILAPSAITFAGNNYQLQPQAGGGLNVGAGGMAVTVSGYGQQATLTAPVTGPGIMTVAGPGTLVLAGSGGGVDVVVGSGANLRVTGIWDGTISNSATLTSSGTLLDALDNSGSATLSGTAAAIVNQGGGTIGIAAAGLGVAAGSQITNNAQSGLPMAAVLTLNGDLTGFGNLQNAGASAAAPGQITVNAGTTLSGGTLVNATYGYVTNYGTIAADITNAAGASLNNYSGGQIIGDVTLTGGTFVNYATMTGTLTNAGTYRAALGAVLDGDYVTTGTTQVMVGGAVFGGTVTQTAGVFQLSADATVAGDFLLSGTLGGTGTLSVAGDLTASGALGNNGNVIISAGSVTLLAGSTLASGTMLDTADLTLGDGLAALTLSVSGDFGLDPGGMLTLHHLGTSQDRLAVTGVLTLDGVTIAIDTTANLTQGTSLTLASATSGLSATGISATLSGQGADFGWILGVTATQLALIALNDGSAGGAAVLDLSGGTAAQVVLGGDGFGSLVGGGYSVTGASVLCGVDAVIGTAFDDILDARDSAVAVTLSGGAGADTLFAGSASDILTGGAGADRFVFTQCGDPGRITDFTSGEDLIDLSALTATAADMSYVLPAEMDVSVSCFGNEVLTSAVLIVSQTGADALVRLTLTTGGLSEVLALTLENCTASGLSLDDFLL
jgi:hypothetical protein